MGTIELRCSQSGTDNFWAAATLCVGGRRPPQLPQKRLGGPLGDPFGTLGLGPVPQKRLGGPFFDPFGKAIPERVQNRPRTLETDFWYFSVFYRV